MNNVWLFLIPIHGGLADVALLRLLVTVSAPINLLYSAVGVSLLSALSDTTVSTAHLAGIRRHWTLIFAGLGLAAWLGLYIAGDFALRMLSGGRYSADPQLWILLGALQIAVGFYYLSGTLLRAADQIGAASRCSFQMALAVLPIGVPCTFQFGIVGAMSAYLAVVAGTAALQFRTLWGLSRGRGGPVSLREALQTPLPARVDTEF